MRVITFDDPVPFLRVVQPLLETDEARHSLILGVVRRLVDHPEWVQAKPYLALVEQDEEPLLVAMMTPPYGVVLAAVAAEKEAIAAIPTLIADLQAGEWQVPDFFGPSRLAQAFVEYWTEATDTQAELDMHERLHVLHEVQELEPVPGRLRQATEEDVELLSNWGHAFQTEALGREEEPPRELIQQRLHDIYIWEDGRPVSMLMRSRPTGRGITVTWVYTPPEQRRQGYATAAVAALSQRLLDEGYDFCTLYTDLSNPTSNHIYSQVGYRPVEDFDKYRFHER